MEMEVAGHGSIVMARIAIAGRRLSLGPWTTAIAMG